MSREESFVTRVLKSCDMYKKLPNDLYEETRSNNTSRVIIIFIIVILCFSELSMYLNPEFASDLQIEDVIGSHSIDLEGTLKKRVLDKDGKVLEVIDPNNRDHDTETVVRKTIEDMDMNKGCNLKGTLIVNKINGNFHISSHAYGEAVRMLIAKKRLLDFEHQINHLSFGAEDHISKITQLTGGYNLSPLDKVGESIHPTNKAGHMHHTHTVYYLDIMATKYYIGAEDEYSAHEYTFSMQTKNTHGFPAIFFKFELSPLFINYRVTENAFIIFFIRCCAIIGGVHTISGIFKILRSNSQKSKEKSYRKAYNNIEDTSLDSSVT
ncbi:unnamed protein product [Moneuplotes crassus]|uniref:Uncharacterized protein n=2 Tax=Euplotes crassus TaxID=5936 RepID=A0AAD2CZ33_EUPCR|nr:unnamed protein product [Moneuplotes crassus]